ncbi:hypothetical protein ACH5RR_035862 [Cinchona calisaya]|uniref:Uncharacterized protein n=1 Tax=Cinchona calisaya TaxID=153742 RepID=A0ABD2Y2P3_9GENT
MVSWRYQERKEVQGKEDEKWGYGREKGQSIVEIREEEGKRGGVRPAGARRRSMEGVGRGHVEEDQKGVTSG